MVNYTTDQFDDVETPINEPVQLAPIAPTDIVTPEVTTQVHETIDQKVSKTMLAIQSSFPFTNLMARISQLTTEADSYAAFVIATEDEEKHFIDFVHKLNKGINAAELYRKELTSFPWQAFQTINMMFNNKDSRATGLKVRLERAKGKVENVLDAWHAKQTAARVKAAQDREEAERVRNAAIAQQNAEAEAAAQQGLPPPAPVAPLPPPPLPDTPLAPTVTQGETSKAYMRRGPLDFVVHDMVDLCGAIAGGMISPDCVALVKGKMQKWVRKVQAEKREAFIPGVDIIEKKKLVVTEK